MFDSPFEFCPVCRAYVLLDQTQRECAREHGCENAGACPLRRVFVGIDFAAGRDPAAASDPRAKSAKRTRRTRA